MKFHVLGQCICHHCSTVLYLSEHATSIPPIFSGDQESSNLSTRPFISFSSSTLFLLCCSLPLVRMNCHGYYNKYLSFMFLETRNPYIKVQDPVSRDSCYWFAVFSFLAGALCGKQHKAKLGLTYHIFRS